MGNAEESPPKPESPVFEIDSEVRNRADRCAWHQQCLQGQQEIRCRITDCVGDKVFFTAGSAVPTCKYCHTFGYSCYCSCPLRQELYRKFKI
jgi:hypothetical protein